MTAARIAATAEELDALLLVQRQDGARIALVPTMGNLHDGHLSLCRYAREHADVVVVSIFVNPTQFGPNEDFASYPRTLDADMAALNEAECADFVYVPDVTDIYPHGTEHVVNIQLPELSAQLCGATRPGHFNGVAGVVLRLLNIVRPHELILGEKDYQQLVLMRLLAADLRVATQVTGMPIVRAPDGLALSSRNRYLSETERRTAPLLHRELTAIAAALQDGQRDFAALCTAATTALNDAGFSVDYVEIRAAEDLALPANDTQAFVVLAAARLGAARLIDNVRAER